MNGNYLYLIFFLFFTFLFNLNANNGKKISLSYLASILNKHPSLFASWEYTNEYYSKFLHILIPWMISATDSSLIYDGNPNLYSYDCLNPMYSTFLSGDKLLKPRVIVDFIPFGYDLDKLEIRLYENYEIIDAFIIFESPITQTGVKKPLLFDLVRNTERFSIFSSKIIYLSATKEEMIQTAISLNSKEFPQSNIEEFKWSSENWGLERAMRVLMIKKFQELPSNHEQYDLQQQLLRSLSSSYSPSLSKNIPKYLHSILVDYFESSFDNFTPPLALQNDGDEMILSSFLLHLKNCELSKPSTFPIQPLTYHFKFNLNTLQHEERWKYQTCPQDVASLSLDHYKDNLETYIQSQSDSNSDLDEHSSSSNKYLPPDSLYNYFFIIGPKVDLFYSFLKDNSTLRQHYGHGLPFENTLCLGSGIHMSSIEEPGEVSFFFLIHLFIIFLQQIRFGIKQFLHNMVVKIMNFVRYFQQN